MNLKLTARSNEKVAVKVYTICDFRNNCSDSMFLVGKDNFFKNFDGTEDFPLLDHF